MTTTKPSFILVAIASALALAACSKSSDGGGGSTAADTGAAPADCKHIDYSSYGAGDAVSFKDDVLPIFGLSCTVSGCHRPDQHEAGLNLGYRCTFDTTAKWKCAFPATETNDPTDFSKAHPLDAKIVSDVYTSVMAAATTVDNGTVKRVVPKDPGNSFLLLKLDDQENDKGYACTNQDKSHEDNPGPCGVSMPQGAATLCDSDRDKFDAIARWIAQGAPNN
jgi:hypothetical protein